MKTVQYFSDEYLEQCKQASPEEILEFLESFRRTRELEGVRYQAETMKLIEAWLQG